MQRQFTATVYIISQERTLLIFHRKLKKWLPPGGHIDTNELPSEAAKREALEETGLQIELLSDEHLWVNEINARSLPRPYLCLLEEIPAFNDQPAHQHIDFIYLGYPIAGTETVNHHETEGLRWFTLDEINALESEVEIFTETQETIRSFINKEELCAEKPSSLLLQAKMSEKQRSA